MEDKKQLIKNFMAINDKKTSLYKELDNLIFEINDRRYKLFNEELTEEEIQTIKKELPLLEKEKEEKNKKYTLLEREERKAIHYLTMSDLVSIMNRGL